MNVLQHGVYCEQLAGTLFLMHYTDWVDLNCPMAELSLIMWFSYFLRQLRIAVCRASRLE